ncbi:hypothetical protein DH2020_024053 [Rehmannia glutinosa]|uniref:Glycosyltransferase n=1 Tax=Rehmannia glutinosa TaxID=99300 RepID=A0ABR0W981_REHGL
MESPGKTQKPHAICIPFPTQGHINPMLKLAILLHHKGFHITFVHTEYNYNRLLQSHSGAAALALSPEFQFATITDGLPPPEKCAAANSTQDIRSLCLSTRKNCLAPLNELIGKLNCHTPAVPPVSCVITDIIMGFALDAAEKIGVPGVLLQTPAACELMCYESYLKNGHLDTPIDWVPGVIPLRLKDFVDFAVQTTDPQDPMLDFVVQEFDRSSKASAIIINTFDELEKNVLKALSSICPPIYAVGSLHLLLNQLPENNTLKHMSSSLWKENPACLSWLDSKPENSVIYVNFGSIVVLTRQQLNELAWGLAGSKKNFVWIVRSDLVRGENDALPVEFWEEIGDRGFVAAWSNQVQVLNHAAIGGFLTHCGWNSTMESLCSGVPMLCWPFFSDQRLNCRYVCEEWEIGMEIGGDVKRDEVVFLVRELMDGEKGKMLRKRALEWKKKAAEAVDGSSSRNLDRLIGEVLSV